MKYRPEIDGLRALAVVPVILFHAGFEIFSGGFVGVDVFFVISGYLITTIIIDQLDQDRFSIITFYERRARRILPALFFVMLCCIPFAWLWMVPEQMRDFSQSLIAVSLFLSNVLFWKESGYFDAAAEEKPLLHTWSLAVEEQYYVLFPVFLLLTWKYGRNRVFWMLVAFSLASLALSEWGWRHKPSANFYLAPMRAWELFAGSIAAFLARSHGIRQNNTLAGAGLAAVLFAIFVYDESTPFPSVYALVPVLGVVLIVLYADKATFVARLLSTRLLVGIGLISYSAYLWHQPLFAFARIRLAGTPDPAIMLLLSVVSLALAVLSWRFIETPFRTGNGLCRSRLKIFSFSAVGMAAFLAFGVVGDVRDGFEHHFYNNLLTEGDKERYNAFRLETGYNMQEAMRTQGECHFWAQTFDGLVMEDIKACTGRDGPALLVIGGSHAMNLFNVLAQVLPEQTVVGVSRGFCRLSDWKEYCRPELTFAGLRETESLFDTIIYHQTGKNFANGEDHWADLEANLTTARTIAGDKLTVWGPWVEGRTYYMELVENPALKIPAETKILFDDIDDRFARMAGRLGVEYFSLNRLLTGTLENLISGNCLLFKDANHFSRCGETVIATRYKEPMENAVFAHPGPSDKGPPDERPSAEPLR